MKLTTSNFKFVFFALLTLFILSSSTILEAQPAGLPRRNANLG